MPGRVRQRLGNKDGVDFALGGNRGRWFGPKRDLLEIIRPGNRRRDLTEPDGKPPAAHKDGRRLEVSLMLLSWRRMTPEAASVILQSQLPENASFVRTVSRGQVLRAVT
jgi:hypothetical protein